MYVASDVSKHYGGVRALDGVDFEIRPGEVQGLLGANGAGKSTLVKILVGAERPSEGTLELAGEPVHFANVGQASAEGVSIVSQELNLFPDLDVLENLFLLREPRHGGLLLNRREMARRARPVLAAVGLDVQLDRRVGTLRLAEQQLVEIARALLDAPRILFLDEPTSALQASETASLLGVVSGLRDRGVAVVFVSHQLEDVFAICDTITVLRNGRVVETRRPRGETSIPEVVAQMLGEAASGRRRVEAPQAEGSTRAANDAPLRLSGVAVRNALKPFDLEVEPGEVVGLAGLEGSGPHAVLDVIFGRRKRDGGTITLPNGRAGPRSTPAAVRAGLALVPADRKRLGVMLDKAIDENIAIVTAGPLRRMGVILRKAVMAARAEHWGEQLKITMASPQALVGQLSGGNQQKVVFAKWLEAEPAVVLLDDPSRGVDVGARLEMHALIAQMAERRQIVLLTSSDLEELAEVCDRVVVFFQGAAVGEIRGDDLSERRLLEAINTGVVWEPG
ncbi:MAG: sugar ABC transporter ATP-binding protein [Actinomycetota bacterium]|nr:sugar ABC transporter ATP-binding protein [Actinomycetota bacterium]